MTRVSRIGTGVFLLIAMTVIYGLIAPPSGPRTLRRFDPDRMADLETRMWQAYYSKENVRLFGLLVVTLREQYHYSWLTAATQGYHLARAAAAFGNARAHYEVVLPDLEAGYATAKEWLRAHFDPAAVARAELTWWVARRTPGDDSPEHVATLMADAYALLYEVPRSTVMRPALLRAQAAALRDSAAEDPDWNAVALLLQASYRDLHTAIVTWQEGAAESGTTSRRSAAVGILEHIRAVVSPERPVSGGTTFLPTAKSGRSLNTSPPKTTSTR
jgi:hypothetical protein